MDNNKDDSNPGIPLAGFLFGNIDESGELDTDILDNEAKKHLNSLTRFGFGSFLEEIMGGENIYTENDYSNRRSSQSGSDSDEQEREPIVKREIENYGEFCGYLSVDCAMDK